MYKKILVSLALDQGHGGKAMEVARGLKADGGKIVAVHVLESVPGFASYYLPAEQQQKNVEAAEVAIAERVGDDADVETAVFTGHPGRKITEFAKETGADCIIVGSHNPELSDCFLGGTAARVVRHAHCAVHVLR